VPGTLAGAADFDIVGPYLASHLPNLQVWAEMRREGALQTQMRVFRRALHGRTSVVRAFNYYLGWLADSSVTHHYRPLVAARYGFVDQWGLATAMGDLHKVVERARDHGKRSVILGGHSLGGAEAAIYPAWDFNGRAGYRDIKGIIGIDGDEPMTATRSSSATTPITTAAQARAALAKLRSSGPFADLLGFGLPWITGPFAELGALAAERRPNAPSILAGFPLLPAELKAPVVTTNLAALGYDFDASTSPSTLALIHVHSGHLSRRGSPRGWVNTGPTPAQDVAFVFSHEPLGAVDWYYPERLSIDTQAARSLTRTPAAKVLGLRLTHLHQVDVPLYVIQTSLGGTDNAVAKAARAYQRRSRIPSVRIVNRASSYGHLDPLLAAPARNAFLKTVVPWLRTLPGYRHHGG
jgi:Lipase (class 3)